MYDSNLPNIESLSPEAQENIRNRVFRVFISSTFIDMQQERDRLHHDVFPRFKKRCKERDVEFVPIDFRWGITDAQTQKGRTVGICLKEIQRSRPFFIGLLGERYGWSPKEKDIDLSDLDHFPFLKEDVQNGLSVTEIEFQFALKGETQAEAGFWIRSDKIKTPEKFCEKDADSIEKLKCLKEKLRAQKEKYPVADYVSPKDLGVQVERFLNERLDKYFPSNEKLSWLEKQNVAQGSFERSRKRLYVPNKSDYDRLNAFVASKEKTLTVVGASGLGKSALLANWKDACAQNFLNVKIVAHYVSASENSDLPANILRRLTESLDPNVATEKEPQQSLTFPQKTLDDFSNEFAAAVAQYLAENPEKRLLFVVDGLNQLSEADDAKELCWLPELPDRAQYILSTVVNDQTLETIERREWNRYEINVLDKPRLKSIIEEFLKDRGKTLTDAQERKILEFPLASNPLVLRTLLEELCVFGVHEKLDAEIERYAQAKDVNDFFSKVFERLESNRQFVETNPKKRKEIVEKLALLLALSRFGLDEEELCRVAKLKQTAVSTFLCMLDAQLVNRSGRYSFAHEHIRQAVLNRYADKIVKTRRLLIGKFLISINESKLRRQKLFNQLSLSDSGSRFLKLLKPHLVLDIEYQRDLQEVPFQYMQLESWEELRNFLLDFDVLETLYDNTFNNDFCTYWNAALRNGRKDFNFISYLELNSSEPSNWFQLADIAYKYKDFSTSEVAFQKSKAIRCKLAKENPQAYTKDIKGTTNNLAVLHFSTNRLPEAEREYKKIISEYRELVQEKPKAYLPDLAMTLYNLAALYKVTNRLIEAEIKYKEALKIYRKLARENPKKYLQDVAATLNNLANLHHSSNRMDDAEKEHKEALEIRRKLATENPQAYKPDIAMTLNNLANLYSDTNRTDNAKKEYEEALEIYRELATENPNTYKQYVVGTLNNLALLLISTVRQQEALTLLEESISNSRDFAEISPVCQEYLCKALILKEILEDGQENAKGFDTDI